MTLWLGIAILSLVSLLLVGWTARKNITVVRSNPLGFYKAQLEEIESDVSAGMLSKEDAETASLEIKRRLIKVGDKTQTAIEIDSSKLLFYSLAAIIIAGSLALYSKLGSPTVAGKSQPTPEIFDQHAIAEKSPDNPDGWVVLGARLSKEGRYSEAADAFARASKLRPESTSLQLRLAEQIMAMHSGRIVPAASHLLQTILTLNPNHPGALFYAGLKLKQDGNIDGARSTWQSLVARSKEDAPWLPMIKREIAALDGPVPPAAGPSRADVEAVENMSPEEQEAFINDMLGRLRDKLAENPDNAQGWLMLARSENSRGNKEAAINTLKEGLKSVTGKDRDTLQFYLNSLKSDGTN